MLLVEPRPRLVEDLEAEDLGVRGHAADARDPRAFQPLALVVQPAVDRGPDRRRRLDRDLAGDNARDMGAVAGLVLAGRRIVGFGGVDVVGTAEAGIRREVAMVERAVEAQRVMRLEVRMAAVHPGIDHRPDDVVAERAEGVARGVGLDRADRLVDVSDDLVVEPDLVDRAPRRIGGVAARKLADRGRPQAGEDVLLAELALADLDALVLHLRGDRIDQLPDLGTGALTATSVVQIGIDDDIEYRLGRALHLIDQRHRDDGLVEIPWIELAGIGNGFFRAPGHNCPLSPPIG